MKTIKIKFVDFWDGCDVQTLLFYKRLCLYYNVELSENPDYLVYSVFGTEHLKYKKCIKIFYTGENIAPDFNFCDYALGFDYIDFGDRYLRFPIFYLYKKDMLLCEKKHLNNDEILQEKNDFCSFVYSCVYRRKNHICTEFRPHLAA